MKKNFLKLLVCAAICVSSVSGVGMPNNISLAQESNIVTVANEVIPTIKFSLHEGDMIIGTVIFDKKYDFVEGKASDSSITVDIVNGQVQFYNLKPNTTYKNISINLKDKDGKLHTFKIGDFTTPDKTFVGYGNVSVTNSQGNLIGTVTYTENPSLPIGKISHIEISDNSLKVDVINNVITIQNLKENTKYSNLTLRIVNDKKEVRTISLNEFTTPSKDISQLDVKISFYNNEYRGDIILPENIFAVKAEISDKSLLVDTVNGSVTILNLKPETTYENLVLNITDEKNQNHSFKLKTFSTKNKDFSYADVKVEQLNMIQGVVILPNNLKISDAKISDPNIKFVIENNSLILLNLKPNTTYENLKIIVQDENKELHNFVINKFSTTSGNQNLDKISAYVKNAYIKAFDRTEIDQDGFNYWVEQLSQHKIGGRQFILNLLETDEFIKVTKDSKDKITRIYAVMFNRVPDFEGLQYWIKEYEKEVSVIKDEKKSVANIVSRMTDSDEFKNVVVDLGIKY